MGKLTHPYQMGMEKYSAMGLYVPDGIVAATTGAIGPRWTVSGTLDHPAPTAGYTTFRKRGRFTVVAGVANNMAGIHYANATDLSLHRGVQGAEFSTTFTPVNKYATGGYYCSFRFRIDAWPTPAAPASRLFVGISDSLISLSGTDSTAIAAANYYGIMHDTADPQNALFFVSRSGGGARTKTQILTTDPNGGTVNPVLDAGRMFLLEIFAWGNQATQSLVLWDLNEAQPMFNVTGGPADTSFCGPQVSISNGSVAANAPAVSLLNVYYFSGD